MQQAPSSAADRGALTMREPGNVRARAQRGGPGRRTEEVILSVEPVPPPALAVLFALTPMATYSVPSGLYFLMMEIGLEVRYQLQHCFARRGS
jgi:hypothetical protein